MYLHVRLVYIFVSAWLLSVCECKDCVTEDVCKCTFDDNSGTIDLTSTARRDGYPLCFDEPASDGYYYSYNPCLGFSEGACSDVAVCQYDASQFGFYDLGTPASASFSYDGLNVIVAYTSIDGARATFVTLVCDPDAITPTVDVQGEGTPLQYYLTMTSSAACPVGGGSGSGISAGSVLIIVFFSLLVVYLGAGVAFNKVRTGSSGTDLIPNRALWTGLPGLIKDGFGFTLGCLMCKRRSYGVM